MHQNKVLKILIADDDPDDRKLVALAFKEAELNHTIDFVRNGDELMEHLKQLPTNQLPDLLLLDLNMPGKDGRVALKEIKSDTRFQKLNIIIFSTCISEEDKTYTSGLGVREYFTKPPGFYELVDIIKNISDSINYKKSYQ